MISDVAERLGLQGQLLKQQYSLAVLELPQWLRGYSIYDT